MPKLTDDSGEVLREITWFTPGTPPRTGVLVTSSGTTFTLVDCLSVNGFTELPEMWHDAALLGLALVAQGAIAPTLGAGDFPIWRIGPLTSSQSDNINNLLAALPDDDSRLGVEAFLSAVVDAAPRLAWAFDPPPNPQNRAFTEWDATPYPELRSWAQDLEASTPAHTPLVIQIKPEPELGPIDTSASQPADFEDPPDSGLRAVVQLRHPELVDVVVAWPDLTPAQRGNTMLTLRRAVPYWPPLERLLDQAIPGEIGLDDTEVMELAGPVGDQLRELGLEISWPAEVALGLDLQAELFDTPTPTDAEETTSIAPSEAPFGGNSLFSFQWRVALGGIVLTQHELDTLTHAARPVVRLRNRWVVLDDASRQAIRSGTKPQIPAVTALAMALDGMTELGGRAVKVSTRGRLTELQQTLLSPVPPEPQDAAAFRRPVPAALHATLREYQRDGLDWLDRMTSWGLGAVLADDMGLGKTITAIALHARRQENPTTAGPTLVICPASLLGNWHREIASFAPGTKVTRFHGPTRTLDAISGDHIVLTTYATMRSDASGPGQLLANSWGLIVADEAQQVKNPTTRTARALRAIPGTSRIALTGTPIENTLEELWAIIDWTTPGLLGPRARFKARWAIPITDGTDPLIAQRFSRLIKPFLLRRVKTDPGIAPELPPKTETNRPVSLTPEQVGLYEALLHDTLEQINGSEGITRRGLIVALMTGLKQICNHPAQYLHEKPRSFGRSFATRSGKVELLDELVDTILTEGGSVLVFTQYVAMAQLLGEHFTARGIGHLMLHGGTPVPQRELMVEAFQRGEAKVFLLSLKAAGTGLNLTRADHVIHLDRWWNPAVEDQATDRAYRIGQTRPVQVHRLIAEGTIEDRIAEMLTTKRDLADSVLRSGDGALTNLSNAELAALVELRSTP